jgi:ABC-type nickel/cobalt efflux system permease component RcnA
MFGIDDSIASLSDGASMWLVLLAAILLGLRHATDPDHLAAMTTLIASGRNRAARSAARLGFAWGLGHGTTLFIFGLPIVLFDKYLPERGLQLAETAIALVIVYLAVRLLVRWRRGAFHAHAHAHNGSPHVHLHEHAESPAHGHEHRTRSRLGAYGIGLVHGMGGSAGVGVLIVASVDSTTLSVISLVLLAVFTAVSMTMVTGGYGLTLVSRPVRSAFNGIAPALGALSLTFGIWYGTAAWGLAPYPF